MKKLTKTEELINKAVNKAKKEISGTNVSNCHITMNMQADGATQKLADALEEQAIANAVTSQAMLKLAEALKPIDVYAIKITNDRIDQ